MGAIVSHPRTGRIYVALHGGGVTAQGGERVRGRGRTRTRLHRDVTIRASPTARVRLRDANGNVNVDTRARLLRDAEGSGGEPSENVLTFASSSQLHSHAASPAYRVGNRCERARARGGGRGRGGENEREQPGETGAGLTEAKGRRQVTNREFRFDRSCQIRAREKESAREGGGRREGEWRGRRRGRGGQGERERMARGAANKGDVHTGILARLRTRVADARDGGSTTSLAAPPASRGDGSSFSPYVTSRSSTKGGGGRSRKRIPCTTGRGSPSPLLSLSLPRSPFLTRPSVSPFSLAHDGNADRTYVREGDGRAKQLLVASARGLARGQREKRQAGASERVHWLRHNREEAYAKNPAR